MKRNSLVRLSGVILVALLIAVSAFAQERGETPGDSGGRCDLRSLRGSYGYTILGGVNDGSDPTLQTHATLAGLGRIVFDGRGGHTGFEIVNFASQFINRTYTGTYTVNSDCTGTLHRTEVPLSNSVVRFVIVDGGKQIFFMQIDNPDAAVQGTAIKQ